MESREQRIATLAATLKASGIAKSDSQAKMMAEDMIGVEEHVQKDYEVEHAKAHEYLQTAKNLGTPRQTIRPEPSRPEVTKESSKEPSIERMESPASRKIEPLQASASGVDATSTARSRPEPVLEHTDLSFGKKTLNQAYADHDTHNSALEAIKAQLSNTRIVPLEDMVPEDVQAPEPVVSGQTERQNEPEPTILKPVVSTPVQAESKSDEPKLDAEPGSKDEPKKGEPKLDTQRLIDMMEEDGKLEEHSREIKEKPKDVKPKEAYEENGVDLSSMFDFNKGAVRK